MFACALALACCIAEPAYAVDVDGFVRRDKFEQIKISPTGEYLAATVPLEDRTILAVIRRSDNKMMGHFSHEENTVVAGFHWVNASRVVISLAEKIGALDQPRLTGNLYAMNADGTGAELLAGQGVTTNVGSGVGSKIQAKKVEDVAVFLVDDLERDDRNVIVSTQPFAREPYTRVERMDVYTGRRSPITTAPVRNAGVLTDHKGQVRLALGVNLENSRELYYREDDAAAWRKIADESTSGRMEFPIGFSEDDRFIYMQVEQASGPDAIVRFDPASGERTEVYRDSASDPVQVLYVPGTATPIGARASTGAHPSAWFEPASAAARLYRGLEAAFPGHVVTVTSTTADRRLALVHVGSDVNPGDYYLFDTASKKADYVVSKRDWLDPEKLHPTRPFSLKARDGITLHGYLTVPRGNAGSRVPMIVHPHGGPIGVQDRWGFDPDVQMLASAGYAVLQLNFRGSAGFGHSFTEAGAKQWGLAMQDDLTDATRWAVQEGIADGKRVCLYGASYGAYASLMGVAKEPSLYACAVGYVGVYDLPAMVREDSRDGRRSAVWHAEWVGRAEDLADESPTRLASRIKVPVFLAAGGEDKITPIEQSRLMERALKASGVPVETLYYDTEGHGFYKPEHRREFYTRLLAFLSRSLGGATASTAAATGSSASR
jgi:dipeptidyl aminopeptidase/acylaminoacyl peptidase